MKRKFALTRCAMLGSAMAAGATRGFAATGPACRDPHAPVEARAHELLGRMTLEEKAQQVRSRRLGIPALFHDEAAHGHVASGATACS